MMNQVNGTITPRLHSLQDQSGRYTGHLVVLLDITEDKLKDRLD